MDHDLPRRPMGHPWGLAVACLSACGMLTAPALAAADASAAYENLSVDAKLVVQTTNEAFGGEIGEVCGNELKVIHKKVFEITNALRKSGAFQGQGYYGLEARTYYSRRCRDFE